jgi:DNA-directed RNA polymerase subunit K/omega
MFQFDLISKAMGKEPNKFLLVHLIAKRMHQLADGATPISSSTQSSRVNTALQEFIEDKIEFKDQSKADE